LSEIALGSDSEFELANDCLLSRVLVRVKQKFTSGLGIIKREGGHESKIDAIDFIVVDLVPDRVGMILLLDLNNLVGKVTTFGVIVFVKIGLQLFLYRRLQYIVLVHVRLVEHD